MHTSGRCLVIRAFRVPRPHDLKHLDSSRRHNPDDCFFGDSFPIDGLGQPIAIASTTGDTLAVQLREPAQLWIFPAFDRFNPIIVELSPVSKKDTGHQLFHLNTGAGIACASCHPEAHDDGKVWDFECVGPRRTQALRFGVLGTEPLHWDGDMDSFDTLMNDVFVGRMSGGQPRKDQIDAMAEWIDAQRPPPRALPADLEAVERGRVVFNGVAGCAACHNGAKFTDNKSYDVGTGGEFQVPNLIGLAERSPFIHTGCAKTLHERFTKPNCGGGDKHGNVSSLTDEQIDDMVKYLLTL